MRRRQALFDLLIRYGPGDNEPVSANPSMQRALRLSVHVFDILGDVRAEHIDVEMGVPRHERIVRPVDHHATDLLHGVALKVLQASSQTEISCLGPHGEHVGPVYDASVLHTGEAIHEAEQLTVGVERASGHTTHTL